MATSDLLAALAGDIQDAYSAVNTKGGTIPQNKNTNNLATAIGTIPTGSSPTGTINITENGTYDVTDKASAIVDVDTKETIRSLLTNQLTEYIDNTITSLRTSAFRNCTSLVTVDLPNVTNIGFFGDNATPSYGFNGCTDLIRVNLPNYEGHRFKGRNLFSGCTNLKELIVPKLKTIASYMFEDCKYLVTVDLRSVTYIDTVSFSGCSRIKNILLTKQATLSNTNAFNNTPFRNGTGGTVYVPYALISTYQNATNWSALESTTFAAIETNLIALQNLGVDITDYYEIVTALPTSDIATDKVYLIATQTSGTYEQWFYGSGSWVQLANITLGGSQ